MPEARPSERRPIVPDPDTSLTRPRRPSTPQPRLWPLKFAVLVLLAMLVGLAWLGWQERERLNAQVAQVTSEMSNVHARFDAEEGRGAHVGALDSRLSSLEDHNESIVARLAGLEVEVQQVSERDASRVEALDERVDAIGDRLGRLVSEADNREAMLAAVRTSLDSLERVAEEGREALAARIETLGDGGQLQEQRFAELQSTQEELVEEMLSVRASLDERLDALDEHVQHQLEEQLATLETAVETRQTELESRLDSLAADVEAVAETDEAAQAVGELQARLASIETELRELRQEQLTLSAGLEALQ
ncbi:hypothetical protein [Billgrantia kenyensis]|uniref:Uncharacterized protein n=1 Tax=Billgrantia kenyensis TaxID=321266 RepID=A0A7V9VXT4_9GAMM|nr:hypothetical protein [Halomonas kenyensis]MBA2777393.1 hypothetical protein [Halomonas kenyensis]MCG6660063.1 hypothetical protein [Halomonas kenyensis]